MKKQQPQPQWEFIAVTELDDFIMRANTLKDLADELDSNYCKAEDCTFYYCKRIDVKSTIVLSTSTVLEEK